MSSFTEPSKIDTINDIWYACRDTFTYYIGSKYSRVSCTVAESFVSDYSSIPSIARSIIKPNGPYAKAGLLHNKLYLTKKLDVEHRDNTEAKITRKKADLILFEALLNLGCPGLKAASVYYLVRFLSSKVWHNTI